jgi:hypothetical protein
MTVRVLSTPPDTFAEHSLSAMARRRQPGALGHRNPKQVRGRATSWVGPGGWRRSGTVWRHAEQPGFCGGYITQSYGKKAVVMDAVQLEFGAAYRSTQGDRVGARRGPLLVRL